MKILIDINSKDAKDIADAKIYLDSYKFLGCLSNIQDILTEHYEYDKVHTDTLDDIRNEIIDCSIDDYLY